MTTLSELPFTTASRTGLLSAISRWSNSRCPEEHFAETPVCTRYGIPEKRLGCLTDHAFHKPANLCFRQGLLAGAAECGEDWKS